MSLIHSVALANDDKLIKAHKLFKAWKKPRLTRWNQSKSDFHWAQAHWDCNLNSRREITRQCDTFTSKKTYARAIATTYIKDGKAYWKSGNDPDWKSPE